MVDRFRTFCVVDESITIKNTEAGRTQRLLELAHRFKYRLILSGTPLTQGLIDLYSQIKFMNPAILNMTESQFANNFLHVSYDQDKTRRKWSCPEKEQHLIKLMRPYIYECDLDFDCPIKRHDYNFNLSAKEAEYYQMEKEDFLQSKEKIAFFGSGTEISAYLHHFLSKDFGDDSSGKRHYQTRRKSNYLYQIR